MPKYPAVYSFRGRNQEETIKKFAELDKEQMKIAQLRIREKLIPNLPDVNKITSAHDEGRFVLGIECDGATYHSSRTARERDRLSQGVLGDIGWTIYRIWL